MQSDTTWTPTDAQMEAYERERKRRRFGPYSAPTADLQAAHAVLTPDEPAAPDKDAVPTNDFEEVRELHATIREHEESPIDAAHAIHELGYRRRPTMTVSEFDEAYMNADQPHSVISYLHSIAPITIIPDSAPTAEIPVVEIPLSALIPVEDYLRNMDPYGLEDAIAAITAALTRATES